MSADGADLLSPDDIATLRTTGVLRAFVPEQYGGARETVSSAAHRIAQVAAWNADAGWLAAVAAVTNLAVSEFPAAALDEIWGDDPDLLIAGTLAPAGALSRSDDGVVVRATSTPASGLQYADWVMATAIDDRSSAPTRVLVPVGDVRVERTWAALGLNGARGDTAHLESVHVPSRRARVLVPPGSAAPLPFFATLFFASAVVGMVRAAASTVLVAAQSSTAGRWDRPDVRATTSGALRRAHRAEALLEGAVGALGTRSGVDAMSPGERALAADLAVAAVTEAEPAMAELISAFGPAALTPSHPLARTLGDVLTGARHTALSPAKAALAHEAALFDGRA